MEGKAIPTSTTLHDQLTARSRLVGDVLYPAVEVARIISEPATRCATPTFSAKPKASFLKDWEC